MKLVFFNDFTLGVLKEDNVVDVTDAVRDVPHLSPQELISGVISNFDALRGSLDDLVSKSDGVPIAQVRIRPPLPKPTHIVAMAANYMESGSKMEPPAINAFLKSSSSVIGTGDTLVLPEVKTNIFHHEAELGLVMSKEASNVSAGAAYEYVFGYVNFIDGSARGAGRGFFWGKSWNTFGPMGPWLVTADEIPDPQNMPIKLWVNGELRQDFSTSDMAYDIPRCVEWSTRVTTLEPGDLIATGTNHQGLGAMQDGDRIEMECEGLGRLAIDVQDNLKREWSREIDQATADRVAGRTTTGGFGEPAR